MCKTLCDSLRERPTHPFEHRNRGERAAKGCPWEKRDGLFLWHAGRQCLHYGSPSWRNPEWGREGRRGERGGQSRGQDDKQFVLTRYNMLNLVVTRIVSTKCPQSRLSPRSPRARVKTHRLEYVLNELRISSVEMRVKSPHALHVARTPQCKGLRASNMRRFHRLAVYITITA